jgi:hypothetical protein
MRSISLNWTMANGPSGCWWVVASDPRHLDEVVGELKSRCRGEPRIGSWDSCGTVNGPRLGQHLQTWTERASLLAKGDDVAELRQTLEAVSRLALGARRVRWALARPDAERMRLDVELTLAPPQSEPAEPQR